MCVLRSGSDGVAFVLASHLPLETSHFYACCFCDQLLELWVCCDGHDGDLLLVRLFFRDGMVYGNNEVWSLLADHAPHIHGLVPCAHGLVHNLCGDVASSFVP